MRYAGAIDIGATHTKLGVVGEDGAVVARASVGTSAGGEPATLVDAIASGLRPLMNKAALEGHRVSGIGAAVAGFLDREHSTMTVNANLPKLCGFPLRDALQKALGQECVLEVDSNASTVAEYRYAAGRGSKRLLGITIGTGIGGGIIIDGKLLRHTGECAGDLGHVIVSAKGRRCTCGALGCLEAMACSAALRERAGGSRTVREVVEGARHNDRGCLDALTETGWWLGLGLASLAPIFSPDRIVVGGGVAASGDLLLEPARMSFTIHASDEFRNVVPIVGSSYDGWEGIVGAASQFLNPLPS